MSDVDENKLIRDTAQAARADALLNDDLLAGAFDKLESAYIEQMLLTGVALADSYKRDRLHQAIHVLRKVKDGLRSVVENGKVSKAHLSQIQGKRKQAT